MTFVKKGSIYFEINFKFQKIKYLHFYKTSTTKNQYKK